MLFYVTGAGLFNALRDRLVWGLDNESTQKRLLTKRDLTLDMAYDIAVSMETVAKDAIQLQTKNMGECSVNKFHTKPKHRTQSRFRCGKNSHDPTECWFKDKECRQCNKTGHIQKMCKSKQSDNKSYQRKIGKRDCLKIHSLKEIDCNKIWVTPEVEGVKLKMELDTGSALSIISHKDYVSTFPNVKLKPTSVMLKTYTVEAELQHLEDQGILSKVDWCEWATPIVPVVKRTGAVRICGDFKVTVNPVLHADQYPLPRIDDIFASLAGGECFSKIHLAQAYLQMEMEESSRK